MKRFFLPTATLLLLSFSAIAQKKSLPLNENKYRIDLPDYWGHGNKAWKILTEKLPLVSEELKDKDVCGDNCNPKYIVEFYITGPELTGYLRYKKQSTVSTNTRTLVNSIPGTSLVTTPTTTGRHPVNHYSRAGSFPPNEPVQMSGEYVFQCFLLLKDDSGHILTKFILVDTNEVWYSEFKIRQGSYYPSQNPDVFFEKNKDSFTPDRLELLAIVDKKIQSL